jgi:chemotaxis protein CheD
MLPVSTIDAAKAVAQPLMFVDTGVPRLFMECYRLGAEKQRLRVCVAGGARVNGPDEEGDFFQIGKRNITVLRKLLWKNGVLISGEDTGGTRARMMTLELATGRVTLRSDRDEWELSPSQREQCERSA